MDAPTCHCTARSGDSQSVSLGPSTCLSTSQLPASSFSPAQLGPPLPASLPSRETCMLADGTTHILRFSLLCTSCSSVCEQPLNIGIRFPWERMGTCNSAESPRKWGSFEYLQPPNCVTTAALLERSLMR